MVITAAYLGSTNGSVNGLACNPDTDVSVCMPDKGILVRLDHPCC